MVERLAAAGQQAQTLFQQTWIILLFAALFVAMAASMFGFFTVQMEVDNSTGTPVVTKSALLRTARMLMSGSIYVLESAWENNA